jgi:hypothetical protein
MDVIELNLPREFTVTVDFDPENNIFLVEESDIPGLTGWAPDYGRLVDKIAATSMELLRLNRRFITPTVDPQENLNTAVIQVRDARENHVTHRFIAGAGQQRLSAG